MDKRRKRILLIAGTTSTLRSEAVRKCNRVAQAQFKHEVDKLTNTDTEPCRIVSFKLYKSQLPVVEQALETAGLMLASDTSRGYCLEMLCADFLAGASLEVAIPKCSYAPCCASSAFFPQTGSRSSFPRYPSRVTTLKKNSRVRLEPDAYQKLRLLVLERDGWRCQVCGSPAGLEVHYIQRRSQLGNDSERNLITMCSDCHRAIHT